MGCGKRAVLHFNGSNQRWRVALSQHLMSFSSMFLLVPGRVWYCHEQVCVSVCLYARVSQKPYVRTSLNFLRMLSVMVARYSSGSVVMYFRFYR